MRDVGILNIFGIIFALFGIIFGIICFVETNYIISGVSFFVTLMLTKIMLNYTYTAINEDEEYTFKHKFEPYLPMSSYTDLIIHSIAEMFKYIFITPVVKSIENLADKLVSARKELDESQKEND